MEPTAEQLIRDYLNRLSVAARTRLRSDDRRAFLARTRDSIERQSGAPDTADPAQVREVLSALGEPAAAAEQEQARLAAERNKRAAARSGLWRPRPLDSAPAEDGQPGDDGDGAAPPAAPTPHHHPVRRAAVDVSHLFGRELTGDIEKKVKVNRPVTSRWRPGAPAKQGPSRPLGVPRPRAGGSPGSDETATTTPGPGTGSQPAAPQAGGPQGGGPQGGGPQGGGPQGGGPQGGGRRGGSQAPPKATPPGSGPPTAVLPGDAALGAAPPGVGPPGAAPAADGSPGASAPDASPAGAMRPGGGPGAAPTAAPAPAGQAPTPAKLFAQAPPSRQLRLPRARLTGATRVLTGKASGLWRQHRLEAASLVLLTLGGLIYPIPVWLLGFSLWLLGFIVAALSKFWHPWDKWVGLVGPVILIIAGAAIALALGGKRQTFGDYVHEVLASAVYWTKIAPLLGAGYLAWRAYRGRRALVPPWNRPHSI